jgi:fucose 4-O-acetylase-like acetyltransferase
VGILAFLLVVPKNRHFFSTWGKNTLTVYLLHGFLVKGLRAMDLTIEANTMAILVLFIFSMLVTVLLSSKRVGQWIEKGKQVLQPSL